MRRPSECLRVDEVQLRRWSSDEAHELLAAVERSREHLAPWMAWATPDYGPADATRFLAESWENWNSGTAFGYAVRVDGALIGSMSLMARIGPDGLECGYWLRPDHTGKGIATRCVDRLVDEAFRIGADHVEIVHDSANTASGAIPRRLGFTEVARRFPPQEPLTSAENGVDVVWRKAAAGSGVVV